MYTIMPANHSAPVLAIWISHYLSLNKTKNANIFLTQTYHCAVVTYYLIKSVSFTMNNLIGAQKYFNFLPLHLDLGLGKPEP